MTRQSVVHTACAVALLLLLGVLAYALTAAAGSAYGRLDETRDDTYRLRVAANYVTNHIRRADAAGGVAATQSPFGDCLVLVEDIGAERYETRIYLHGGVLRESFVSADAAYDDDTAFDVIELSGFTVDFAEGVVQIALTSGDETRTVSVAPMSGGDGV